MENTQDSRKKMAELKKKSSSAKKIVSTKGKENKKHIAMAMRAASAAY